MYVTIFFISTFLWSWNRIDAIETSTVKCKVYVIIKLTYALHNTDTPQTTSNYDNSAQYLNALTYQQGTHRLNVPKNGSQWPTKLPIRFYAPNRCICIDVDVCVICFAQVGRRSTTSTNSGWSRTSSPCITATPDSTGRQSQTTPRTWSMDS